MKVLILNSGLGSRMAGLEGCKCLVELEDGVSIFDAQIKAFLSCGLDEFVVTTGAHAQSLKNHALKLFPEAKFQFVHNELFDKTNYIYSIWLAQELLRGEDILLVHGDLVFEQSVLFDMITACGSVMAIDSTKPLPEKDFKAVVCDGRIKQVGIEFFKNALYAQPLYKLVAKDWNLWLDEIGRFCERGDRAVYAENALNVVSDKMDIKAFDLLGRACFEADNREDLAYAQKVYASLPDRLQNVYFGNQPQNFIQEAVKKHGKPFVASGSFQKKARGFFGDEAVYFNGFTPNPNVLEVEQGKALFLEKKCDFIVSFGGGSAMDVAKAIKIDMPAVAHLAIPTTAGTGSEATRFLVVYKEGEKQSICCDSFLPNYVVLNPDYLDGLPLYHKKSAALDALCQAIESIWAQSATKTSRAYAYSAMRIIFENIDEYIKGDKASAARILLASNLAGKAINITKTTAAHAMSYKLTSLYGLSHGHAVALCMLPVWKRLLENSNKLDKLTANDYEAFVKLFDALELTTEHSRDIFNNAKGLAKAVNVERLENHPVLLTQEELTQMYQEIGGRQ